MRIQWTANGNRDAGSSCLCDQGLHRYLQNFGGGGLNTPNPPSRYATECMYRALTVADSHHWSLPVKVLIAVHPNVTRQVSSNRYHSWQKTCANRVKTIRSSSSYMGHIAKEIVGVTCAADRCVCIKSRTRNKTAKCASTYDICGSHTLQ